MSKHLFPPSAPGVASVAARIAWALLAALVPGCQPVEDNAQTLPISWTGAPPAIERMVGDYVAGRGVPAELRCDILHPRYYAPPTPFFLFEGNDDAVTLALSARLGTSYPPVDVFFIDLYWFKDFEPEWLTPLDSMTIEINRRPSRLADALPFSLREACELRDKLYAIPLSIRGNCLYYRRDLVKKPPRTWPELIESAKRVLAEQPPESKLKYGIVFHWDELHNDFYPILWGYGGGPPNCLAADGDLDQRLDSQANLEALAMFYRLVHQEGIAPTLDELRAYSLAEEKSLFAAFARGETVFLIDWTNRAARIAGALSAEEIGGLSVADIGIAPIPHGPGLERCYSTIGSWGWVVAAEPRSLHSLELVRELATPAAQLCFFEKHAEIPIYRQQTLYELEEWPAVRARLTPYHTQLLRLIHGAAGEPGVVLRDRPGRKQINRLVLDALQRILEQPPGEGADGLFDRAQATAILRQADREILSFLERLERLGVDCACAQDPDWQPHRDGASLNRQRFAP
jgi:ABC-type glycerol-3-phosphate transport system substrate-binding protein